MLRNLLIYRLVIFNACCLAAVAWAWQRGFIADMYGNDASYMTWAATALFAIGAASAFMRAGKTSQLLNAIKAGNRTKINGTKMLAKAGHLNDIGNLIVTAGLVGTAIGVVMMLHSFQAGSLTDPAKVVETATALGEGVGTAFRSTIVSAILWMWHIVNVRMLLTAMIVAIEDAGRP